MKRFLKRLWMIDSQIRGHIWLSRWLWYRLPVLGRPLSLILDRWLLILYGIDLHSPSIAVKRLLISHPGGILLGGNGIVSEGRVAIMAGVNLVGRSPTDPLYLERHKTKSVFRFGDNVVIGAGSVIIGPVDICDNVTIGAMSLVNKSITEPGVYVGTPARRVKADISDEWVAHRDHRGTPS